MKELNLEGEWHWHYDDGRYSLIAEYDPEGWHARWAEEDLAHEKRRADQAQADDSKIDPNFPFEDLPDLA